MIEMCMGEQPDTRIMMRNVRKVRDLSESTNDAVLGSDSTVLELAREAAVLLADALDKIGAIPLPSTTLIPTVAMISNIFATRILLRLTTTMPRPGWQA